MVTNRKVVVELEIKPVGSAAVNKAFRGIDRDLAGVGRGAGAARGLPSLAPRGGDGGSLLGGTGDALGGAAGALAPVGLAVGAVTAGVVALTRATEGFVEKSNPAVLQRFNLALDDAMAVIGQRLAPILDVVTDAVRMFADVLTALLPSQEQMNELGKVFKDVLESFRPVLGGLAAVFRPVVDVVITVIKSLAELEKAWSPIREFFGLLLEAIGKFVVSPVLSVLSKVFELLIGGITRLLEVVLYPLSLINKGAKEALGLEGGRDFKGASFGAAARPATFSSVDEYSRKIYAAFLSSSGGTGGKSVAQQQLDVQQAQLRELQKLSGKKDTDYAGEGGDFGDAHKRGLDGSSGH